MYSGSEVENTETLVFRSGVKKAVRSSKQYVVEALFNGTPKEVVQRLQHFCRHCGGLCFINKNGDYIGFDKLQFLPWL